MRMLFAFAVLSLGVPSAAIAGGDATRTNDQSQRAEQRSGRSAPCSVRERDRGPREIASRTDCRVTKPVPPVVDPTPIFLL